MKKSPKGRQEIVFDQSWVPEYDGDPVDWLDRVAEASMFHPRDVVRIPMILEAAGVSRKVFTFEVIQAAVRLTYLTVRAAAKKHNRLVALGKASGYVQVSEFDWVAHAAESQAPVTPVTPEPVQEKTPCPSGSSTTPKPQRKPDSQNGKKKSRNVRTRPAKDSGEKESRKSRKRGR